MNVLNKEMFMDVPDEELDEGEDLAIGSFGIPTPMAHHTELVVLTTFGFWAMLSLAAIGATTVVRLSGRAISKLLKSGK